jgi:ubiquinone/menaquinone biosynthesis C-methylase UbiE
MNLKGINVMVESRKHKEKQFHNALRKGTFGQRWSPELENLIQRNPLWVNMKYYSVERKSRKLVLDWYSKNCNEKRVLDYCCGNGEDSFIICKNGLAEVTGIDISETSIKNCKDRAIQEGLEKNTFFHVMDAEALQFDDNYFDIITEYGALHHLNLRKAFSEMARVLKLSGKCICTEALGHNPIIHLYRKRTPHIRTEWEIDHILCKKDINMARTFFNKVEILGFFHLTSLAAVAFRNLPMFNTLLSFLETMDSVILKLPFMKWQAWQIVFVLSEPKKPPRII